MSTLTWVANRVADLTQHPAEYRDDDLRTASFPVGHNTAVEVTQQTLDPRCFDVMILSWDRTGGISAEAEKGSARGMRAAADLVVRVIREYEAEQERLEWLLEQAYGPEED